MVALTFADVIGRRLLGTPVFGAHDLTEHLMGLLVFAGLPLVMLAAMQLLGLAVDLAHQLAIGNYRAGEGHCADEDAKEGLGQQDADLDPELPGHHEGKAVQGRQGKLAG